jgi:hypothetical protein
MDPPQDGQAGVPGESDASDESLMLQLSGPWRCPAHAVRLLTQAKTAAKIANGIVIANRITAVSIGMGFSPWRAIIAEVRQIRFDLGQPEGKSPGGLEACEKIQHGRMSWPRLIEIKVR